MCGAPPWPTPFLVQIDADPEVRRYVSPHRSASGPLTCEGVTEQLTGAAAPERQRCDRSLD